MPIPPRPALVLVAGVLLAACDPGVQDEPAAAACDEVPAAGPALASFVVHVSVDGLRPEAAVADSLLAFARLRREGASTGNARTDVDVRVTLPNHVSQLTGRPALGAGRHGWTENGDARAGETLHTNLGAYVASAFDVVHDRGLRTAAYVSKRKLALVGWSYDAAHGAPDTTGADDGRAKIDTFVLDEDTGALADRLVADLLGRPAAYTFVHLRDPDDAGHARGWDLAPGSAYSRAVGRADAVLGRLLAAAEDPRLAGRLAVVVTSDHGGLGTSHDADVAANYTVPFYVWGAGVPPGDLYAANAGARRDPGSGQVPADAARQPVRNGDAANVALRLLGLPRVPCSTWGAAPLRVRPAPTAGP